MGAIIAFLFALIILVVVLYILSLLLPGLGLQPNVVKALLALFGLIFLLWLFGGGGLTHFNLPIFR
jgi:hypothetical protein